MAAVGGLMVPRLLAKSRLSFGIASKLRNEPRDDARDMSRVAAYHEALNEGPGAGGVDDATWRDLDLDQVFVSLDRTESQIGRQYLYELLRKPKFSPAALAQFELAVQEITGDDAAASRIRSTLQRLADPRASYIVALLFGNLPARPRWWWLFPFLSILSFSCLAIVAFWSKAGLVWLGVCAANICVQLFYKPKVRRFIPAFHEVPALLGVARELGLLQAHHISDELSALRRGAGQLWLLRRAPSWLMFEPGQANELASTLYEYLNLLFLFGVNAFVFVIGRVESSRKILRKMFDAIGYIDAAQSVATWRASLSYWSVPEFSDPKKHLNADSVFHPLLPDAVANSIDLENASVLITGSNMAGKTTFIRTLGVNAVLAQALNTVCAKSWRAPLVHVRSSIARSDSLLEGKSQYLAEIESVRTLIDAKLEGNQNLFLLDELFRGTNTMERVAAAKGVLAYLNRGLDLVFVATHDVELLGLLSGKYLPYHFRETITEGLLSFDYRLRPGPSSTRNALALLELMNYPADVIADARATMDGNGPTSGN